PTAEFPGAAGVLPQLAVFDKKRAFAFTCFNRSIVRIAVVDTKSRILAVPITQRAPTATGKNRREMKRPAGFRIKTESARCCQVRVLPGHHIVAAGGSERFE